MAQLPVALCLLTVPSAMAAHLGQLDPTFGRHGIVAYETLGSKTPRVNGLIVQPDGGVVIGAGSSVVRYRADGRRDPDFKVQRGPTVALAAQPSGKIVWAGRQSVRQLLPNGREQNFGDAGIGEGAVFPGFEISAMAVQEDGKILVGGRFTDGSGIALARLLPDGMLDTSFGVGGAVAVAISRPGTVTAEQGENRDRALSIAPLPDGEILVAGEKAVTPGGNCHSCSTPLGHAVVLEYSAEGRLDPSFGTGGVLSTTEEWGSAFGLQTGGDGGARFLLGGPNGDGYPINKAIDSFAIGAITPDGAWQQEFGEDGVSGFFPVGPEITLARASCAGPEGDIVVAGGTGEEPEAFRLLWIRPDGTLDRRFGRKGIVTTRIKGSSNVLPGAVQVASAPHGRIVAAGFTKNRVVIARYIERLRH